MLTKDLTNGVIIGLLMGFKEGAPLVVFASNPEDHALPARSLAHLSADDVGSEVALLFEDGREDSPLIIGRIVDPIRKDTPVVQSDDDEPIKIESQKKLELRCGKASIVMKSDGTVTIRGTQILTRAERQNRVQGATVSLN